ncbi:RNA polymerase sigma factor [Rhodanobacter ginsenosidimutans]|jgi:RNA polymerase sigma-70 factor (ECF subfamily)
MTVERWRNRQGRHRIQRNMQQAEPPPANVISTHTPALDDAALVALVRSGDREAFRHVVQRYGPQLHRIARGVLNDDAEAEDVVQESFMRAYHRFDSFRGDAPLRTWLVSIVLNEARTHLRKRHAMVGIDQIDSSPVDPHWVGPSRSAHGDPVSLAAQVEIRRLLKRAIDHLPDPYRQVFRLRAIEECSVEETAARLSIKPQTVKTRLFRARRLLCKSLDETLGNMLSETFPFLGVRCACLTSTLMARLVAEATFGSDDQPPAARPDMKSPTMAKTPLVLLPWSLRCPGND